MSERRRPSNSLTVLEEAPTAAACNPAVTRREAVRQIGGWLIFAGALGTLDACGGAKGSTSTGCECGAATSGTNTGLNKTDIPENGFAWNGASSVFICHDAAGFYSMDSICPHSGCDMGTSDGSKNPANLAGGFVCLCHGSKFAANGNVTRGPSNVGLAHYKLTVDGTGALFLDTSVTLVDSSCRCG